MARPCPAPAIPQWKAQQSKETAKAKGSKARFKQIKYQDLGEWQAARDKKFPNNAGAGHTFSKTNKLNLVSARDRPRGMSGTKPDKAGR